MGSGPYRIGKTGAEFQKLGCSHISVKTASNLSAGPFLITYLNGFDNTCEECNCDGNAISDSYYWAGGKGGCHGSDHFGLMKEWDVHVKCGDGVEKDMKWGHFHEKGETNKGVYIFGDVCLGSTDGAETFSFYLSGCAGMSERGKQRLIK